MTYNELSAKLLAIDNLDWEKISQLYRDYYSCHHEEENKKIRMRIYQRQGKILIYKEFNDISCQDCRDKKDFKEEE